MLNRYLHNDFFLMLDNYTIIKNQNSTIIVNRSDPNEIYFFDKISKIIIDNINLSKYEIITKICSIYNVDTNTATKDYDEFVELLGNLNNVEDKVVNETEFNNIFNSKLINQCSIEITNICPFKCDHCYVPKTDKIFMTFAMFKKIVDELLALNTRSILLTGGDPLVNPDFIKMYRYAKENGMFVHINTTLYILSDEIYELFNIYKPNGIEVSVYGYNNETYESFVHVKSSYQNVINNIIKLKKIGVRISLKSVLTKCNYKYISQIKLLAKELGLSYRYDYILFPKINEIGSKNSESITPKEIIEVIKEDKEDVEYFKNVVQNIKMIKNNYVPSNKIFQCGLGKDRIFIDTYGNAKLCLVVGESINIKDKSISEIVKKLNFKIDKLTFKENDKCYKKKLCRYCPGRFYMETESYTTPPDFYCELADELIKEFSE